MIEINTAVIIAIVFIFNFAVSEKCGYDVNASKSFILSPNYPNNYDNYDDCSYVITTPEDTIVYLEIEDMQTESKYDIIYFYDGPSTNDSLLASYTGVFYNIPVNATTNQVLVRFTSDSSNTYKGFNISFASNGADGCGDKVTGSSGSIQSPNYPNEYYPYLDCYYSLSTPEDTAITLNIEYLDLETDYDYIQIYDGPTDDDNIIGTYSGHSPIIDPINASTNQALVYFHTDFDTEYNGFSITFEERVSEVCGEEISGTYGVISSQGYPFEPYPSNQNCYYTVKVSENMAVTLEIIDMDLEEEYDYIEIYDGPNTSSPLIGRYSGVKSQDFVYCTTNEIMIYFHSNSENELKGFYITFTESEIDQVCPPTSFNSDSGVLTSVYYPDEYPSNADCYYSITSSQNTQLTLQTNFLDVESSVNCSKDYIDIFNGSSSESTLLAKLCGTGPIYDIHSSSNEVFVHFHSDSQSDGDGFNITYSTDQCPDTITLDDEFGTIYSPGFPLYNYPNNVTCNHLIDAPLGSRVHLSILYTNIKATSSGSCAYDYIQAFDGPTENDHLIFKLCGNYGFHEYQTTSNQILVQFRSDSSDNGRGFAMNYVTTYY